MTDKDIEIAITAKTDEIRGDVDAIHETLIEMYQDYANCEGDYEVYIDNLYGSLDDISCGEALRIKEYIKGIKPLYDFLTKRYTPKISRGIYKRI